MLRALRALMLALALALAAVTKVSSQEAAASGSNNGFDSTYVVDLTHQVTGRLFLSNKFNSMAIDDNRAVSHITYRPNTNVNFGAGVSYRAITLNIAVGVPALNRDDSLRGNTRYLDAQANLFGRRFATNVFAQDYRGYYIDQLSFASEAGDSSYARAMRDERLRPDMGQRNLGATVLHIVSNDRFSYRAAFNQDAWQRRSAGSWLVGGHLVYQGMRAQRPAVPDAIDSLWRAPLRFRRIEQIEFGTMGGYAHTFVILGRLYFSISASLGFGAVRSVSWVKDPEEYSRQVAWSPNVRSQARVAAGYNDRRRCVGLSYVNEQSQTLLEPGAVYGWSVGNFRLFYVRRFNMRISPVDSLLRRNRRG